MMHHLANARSVTSHVGSMYRTSFFLAFGGTGKAIVHRIGCINTIYISYTLQFQRYSPDNILLVKITTARSNQGHTMILHTFSP